MDLYSMVILICILLAIDSKSIRILRKRHNVFEPPPLVPSNSGNSDPSTTEEGVELEPGNPYLDIMHEPYQAKLGMGMIDAPLGSPMFGGNLYFPTTDLLHPVGNVAGSYVQSRAPHWRFGQQAGPIYPWQQANFKENMQEIEEARTIDQKKLYLPPLPPNYLM